MISKGDVTAKAGAQNTTAGLIGTGSGIILSFFIGADPIHLLLAFIPLSSLNIWTAYMVSKMKS